MPKLKYIIASFFLLTSSLSIAHWLSYPLKQVNIGNCEKVDDCWIDLPIIKNANYISYQDNNLYRVIYTMLRWAGYDDGRDLWLGTHLWVDIATIKWTPVYSILSWEVISAKEDWAWGNIVVIKHIWNDEIIFSTYAHLENFFVKVWDVVQEWDMVAVVWDTGNATWPHLHRQIEKSNVKIHPFYPYGCGNTVEESVNSAGCWDQLYKYTLDPIRFIETNWYNLDLNKQVEINAYLKIEDIDIVIPHSNIGISEDTNIIDFKTKVDKDTPSVLEQPLKIVYDKNNLNIDVDYFYTIDWLKSINALWINEWLTQIKIMYWDTLIKNIYYLIIKEEKLELISKYYDLVGALKTLNI